LRRTITILAPGDGGLLQTASVALETASETLSRESRLVRSENHDQMAGLILVFCAKAGNFDGKRRAIAAGSPGGRE
jgi:hypothetical protein